MLEFSWKSIIILPKLVPLLKLVYVAIYGKNVDLGSFLASFMY